MDIEKVAVNTVSLAISKSDYLVPNINSGDKEPSWDGDIEVYKKAGTNHSKSDLNLKIPIQVKGKVSDNLRKKTISYSVQISDMRNYLRVGGTVYFVVCMDSSGEKTQIYYAPMLPFELKKILDKYGTQGTRQMQMKMLPKDKGEMTDVFLCFARDMEKQKAAILSESVTIEDLAKDGLLKEISIGFITVPRKYDTPFEHLFDHDAYIYAKLPYGVELPVEHFEKLDAAGTRFTAPVTVNGKLFYLDYGVIYKKGITELRFGKSTTLTLEREKNRQIFHFSLNGTLSERIRDAEFIIESLTARQFKIGNTVCPLKDILPDDIERFNLTQRKEHLEWLKTVKKTLDTLRVKDDLDCSHLTKVDEQNILSLKSAILDKKAVPLKDTGELFGVYTIANLKILVCALKSDKDKKLFNVYGFNDAPVSMMAIGENGEEYPSSFYVALTKDSMLSCCNIDYDAMLTHIKAIPFSDKYSIQLNQLLLQLLSAYDESSPPRKDILDTAVKLSEWLKSCDPSSEKEILTLNYYQAVKRLRELEAPEIQEIVSIIENHPTREDFYVGAYILLEDYAAAKIHFDAMPSEAQETFRAFPIFHLWKQQNKEA